MSEQDKPGWLSDLGSAVLKVAAPTADAVRATVGGAATGEASGSSFVSSTVASVAGPVIRDALGHTFDKAKQDFTALGKDLIGDARQQAGAMLEDLERVLERRARDEVITSMRIVAVLCAGVLCTGLLSLGMALLHRWLVP